MTDFTPLSGIFNRGFKNNNSNKTLVRHVLSAITESEMLEVTDGSTIVRYG